MEFSNNLGIILILLKTETINISLVITGDIG